jgi:hypothetical protein
MGAIKGLPCVASLCHMTKQASSAMFKMAGKMIMANDAQIPPPLCFDTQLCYIQSVAEALKSRQPLYA